MMIGQLQIDIYGDDEDITPFQKIVKKHYPGATTWPSTRPFVRRKRPWVGTTAVEPEPEAGVGSGAGGGLDAVAEAAPPHRWFANAFPPLEGIDLRAQARAAQQQRLDSMEPQPDPAPS